NGGRNNMFVAMSTSGSWVMGYFDGSTMKLWKWAQAYTLADHFFMGAFGGSYLNHQWLVCACTPTQPHAPAHPRPPPQARRPPPPRGPGGFFAGPASRAGNPATPPQPPSQPGGAPPAEGGNRALADPAKHPVPPLTLTTVGDTLSAKGISWAWYAGAWTEALA